MKRGALPATPLLGTGFLLTVPGGCTLLLTEIHGRVLEESVTITFDALADFVLERISVSRNDGAVDDEEEEESANDLFIGL